MEMPEGTFCRGCGYALCGLPKPVCPECGRAFDPDNPKTFTLGGQRHRWRRRLVRVGLPIVVLGLFAPHGIMTSSVTLTCPDCHAAYQIRRYQLRPPRWIPFNYPGIYLPLFGREVKAHDGCPHHRYNVSVAAQSRIMVSGTGTVSAAPGEVCYVNGIPALPGNEEAIIDSVTARNGLSFACSPAPGDPVGSR